MGTEPWPISKAFRHLECLIFSPSLPAGVQFINRRNLSCGTSPGPWAPERLINTNINFSGCAPLKTRRFFRLNCDCAPAVNKGLGVMWEICYRAQWRAPFHAPCSWGGGLRFHAPCSWSGGGEGGGDRITERGRERQTDKTADRRKRRNQRWRLWGVLGIFWHSGKGAVGFLVASGVAWTLGPGSPTASWCPVQRGRREPAQCGPRWAQDLKALPGWLGSRRPGGPGPRAGRLGPGTGTMVSPTLCAVLLGPPQQTWQETQNVGET